ncbi:MAG: hypothetical protein IIB71_09765 [Proteobacteria bacterium]|nr:hypothetical protein [Pseudomonadota bacterium]
MKFLEQNHVNPNRPGQWFKNIQYSRAAQATAKIAGKGYSIVEDESLKTLPPPPAWSGIQR